MKTHGGYYVLKRENVMESKDALLLMDALWLLKPLPAGIVPVLPMNWECKL
jgi:hypothetical protein